MTEQNNTTFSFTRRLGYTHYDVHVACDPNAKATYEDRLLALVREFAADDVHPQIEKAREQKTG